MIPLRRLTAFTLLSGGLALGSLAVADVAHADPGTREVAWLVTSGSFADRFGTPQTLYTGSTTCGTGLLQIDTYKYVTPEDKATVDALIAAGHLDNATQDGSVWLSNTDVELTPCPTTPSSTGSPSPTPTSSAPTHTSSPPTSPSPTVSVPVITEAPSPPVESSPPLPVETSAPAIPATSSPAVPSETTLPTTQANSTSTSTPAAVNSQRNGIGTTAAQTSSSTELAYTGTDHAGRNAGIAVALLASGAVLLAIGKKRKA